MAGMAGETTHDARLRDLEAEAFRTGRTLAEHSEQLQQIGEQQTTAFSNIDSLADAIGAPGDRTITQRLDGIEQHLGTIDAKLDDVAQQMDAMNGVLLALARAQGINPEQT